MNECVCTLSLTLLLFTYLFSLLVRVQRDRKLRETAVSKTQRTTTNIQIKAMKQRWEGKASPKAAQTCHVIRDT